MRRLILWASILALVSLDAKAVPWYGIGYAYESSKVTCPRWVDKDLNDILSFQELQTLSKDDLIAIITRQYRDELWNGDDKFRFLNYLANKYPYVPVQNEFYSWDYSHPVPSCIGYGQRDW